MDGLGEHPVGEGRGGVHNHLITLSTISNEIPAGQVYHRPSLMLTPTNTNICQYLTITLRVHGAGYIIINNFIYKGPLQTRVTRCCVMQTLRIKLKQEVKITKKNIYIYENFTESRRTLVGKVLAKQVSF